MVLQSLFKYTILGITLTSGVYFGILTLLAGVPFIQQHVFYLHRVTLTWFKDLNVPEQFGFLHNQVTPFAIQTSDNESLHAWHVLPLSIYRRHQTELLAQPSGFAPAVTSRLSFQLLRDDPEARLVIYLHGTAGCLASGWRTDSYRALYSAAPDKIHVLTVDYRGYGLSTGSPTEAGLLIDAVSVVNWAINTAGIPPSRIVIFGQSLGTAVGISVVQYFASQPDPISFAGIVLVASFSDVATLLSTYKIGNSIPVLSPLARIPSLLAYFNSFLHNTWLSKDRIADFIRLREDFASTTIVGPSSSLDRPHLSNVLPQPLYHVTFIHALDDADIPSSHTNVNFFHAVNATLETPISYEEFQQTKAEKMQSFGGGGEVVEWKTKNGGVIREEIVRYGVHDRLMSWPIVGNAIARAFEAAVANDPLASVDITNKPSIKAILKSTFLDDRTIPSS